MPKPKYGDLEGSKRFFEISERLPEISAEAFERSLRDVASAPPAPALTPKARPYFDRCR